MQVWSGVDDPGKDMNINICDSASTAKVFRCSGAFWFVVNVDVLGSGIRIQLVVRDVGDVKRKQGEVLGVGDARCASTFFLANAIIIYSFWVGSGQIWSSCED